jgi:CRP/FNR family cyclic AMP-dependent transcriptional regulator
VKGGPVFHGPAPGGKVLPVMASESSEVDRAFLTRIPIFAGLPDRVIDLIASTLRVVHVVAGAQLLREGEHARSMFVVRDGELQILKRGDGGTEFKLAVLKTGDCVGEMALIDIQPRSATARALGPATVYVLELAEIAKLYEADVEAYALLVLNIAREISRRLRLADDVLAHMGMTAEAMWSDARGTTTHPAMPVVTD